LILPDPLAFGLGPRRTTEFIIPSAVVAGILKTM
jgi:hypothetical protein